MTKRIDWIALPIRTCFSNEKESCDNCGCNNELNFSKIKKRKNDALDIITNKELFQNEEKEKKRAADCCYNKELLALKWEKEKLTQID
jgi:hypothetical protein